MTILETKSEIYKYQAAVCLYIVQGSNHDNQSACPSNVVAFLKCNVIKVGMKKIMK